MSMLNEKKVSNGEWKGRRYNVNLNTDSRTIIVGNYVILTSQKKVLDDYEGFI